jgi:ABC-2 type transport system ATP-binding protein
MLHVENLVKRYPGFTLDHVNLDLEPGYILGYIGRNGAGKTTTLKAIMNLVRPDEGSVFVDGLEFSKHEFACKQRIGFVLGAFDYYPRKKLRVLAETVRPFYPEWDQSAFERLMKRFKLDPGKRVNELSAGMKVKFAIALALSHNARLLILDEPTSGLDPVSREDLVTLFQDLVAERGVSILFSTHITSDLERCADYIAYIKEGKIIAHMERDELVASYRKVQGTSELLDRLNGADRARFIGLRKHKFGFEALMRTEDAERFSPLTKEPANLEEIMVHMERSER